MVERAEQALASLETTGTAERSNVSLSLCLRTFAIENLNTKKNNKQKSSTIIILFLTKNKKIYISVDDLIVVYYYTGGF